MKQFGKQLLRLLRDGKVKVFTLFQKILKLAGIESFLLKPGYHYAPDYYGRQAAKQVDIRKLPVFGELAAAVIKDGRSTLYYDRLYTIYQLLVHLTSFVSPGHKINMAEVGVYKGGTSYFIASVADRIGLDVTHHSFDTFMGHAAQDINAAIETVHRPHLFNDTDYELVKKYLSRFDSIKVHQGRFQDACHYLQDSQVHFVHLDMDIYEPTIFALNFFDGRLVKGGVILLDDYGISSSPGIEKAIKEFMTNSPHYFGIALLSGQYILVKN